MKKKIYISVLTTILCFPLFMWTPLANAVSQSYTTGYGSYYFTYNNDLDTFLVTFGNLGGIYMKGYCQTLTYEFNDTYSGYLDIHLLSESIFMNATVITENCYVKGKNSSQWDYSIGFKDVTSIKVTIVLPTMSTNNSWSGNKMALTTNYNITRDVTTVEDYLEDIETTMGQIDAQLSTMNTSLSNIYGVENASRQLLTEIEYAIRGNNTLYVLSDDMGTIITDLNGIINKMNNMNISLMMSNVPVGSYNAYSLFGFLGQLYQDEHEATPYYIISDTAPNYMLYLTQGVTYYMSLKVENPAYYGISAFITVVNSDNNQVVSQQFNIDYNNHQSRYTMVINPTVTGTYTIKFSNDYNSYIIGKKIYPIFFGELYQVDNDISILTGLPYNVNSRLDTIIDKLSNFAVNVNNLTVNATGITYNTNQTQVNNTITNYNNNINQVYSIENNLTGHLDNDLHTFTPSNQYIVTRLTSAGNLISDVLNRLNGIELISMPVIVALVGIVLLAIVG